MRPHISGTIPAWVVEAYMPRVGMVDPFIINQLTYMYTIPELRELLHDAELEAWGLQQAGADDVIGFAERQVRLLKAAIEGRTTCDPYYPPSIKRPLAPRSIDPETVKERVNLTQTIETYIKLRKQGSTLVGLCPLHHEKTPSFVVFPDTNHWRCFGCDAHGDVFDFLMKVRNLTFREVLGELAGQLGLEVSTHVAPMRPTLPS